MPRVEIPGPPVVSYAQVQPHAGGPDGEIETPIGSQLIMPLIADDLLASIQDPFAEMPHREEGVTQ